MYKRPVYAEAYIPAYIILSLSLKKTDRIEKRLLAYKSLLTKYWVNSWDRIWQNALKYIVEMSKLFIFLSCLLEFFLNSVILFNKKI